MSTVIERFYAAIEKVPEGGCWIWMKSLMCTRYGCIRIDKKTHTAHRLSWQIHNGPIPDGMHVLHRCDVRECVNPHHLFLGTNQENITDSVKKGRRKGVSRNRPKGLKYNIRVSRRKLTDSQICQAKELRESGWSFAKIGALLGCSEVTVGYWVKK
jgi:hypothetical protein